jgi:hypothetical protein
MPKINQRNIQHSENPDVKDYYGDSNQSEFETTEHGDFTQNESRFSHPFLNTMYTPSTDGESLDTNKEYSIRIEHEDPYEKNTIQEHTMHDKGDIYTKVDQKDILWKRNEEYMRKNGRNVSTKRNENIYREGDTFYGEDERGTKSQISESDYDHVKANKDVIRDLVSRNTGGNFEERGITDQIASLADANNYPGKRQVEIQKEHMRGERFYGVSDGTHHVTQLYDDDDQTSSHTTRPVTRHFGVVQTRRFGVVDAKSKLIEHEDERKDLYIHEKDISDTVETTHLHNKKPFISKISATLLDHEHGPDNQIKVSRHYHHYTQEITDKIGDDGKEFTYKPPTIPYRYGAKIDPDGSYRYSRKNDENTHSSTSSGKDHERSHSSTSSREDHERSHSSTSLGKDHEKTHSSTSFEKDHEKPHSSTRPRPRPRPRTKYIRRRIPPEEYEEREKDVDGLFQSSPYSEEFWEREKDRRPELNTVKMTPNYQRTVKNTIPNYSEDVSKELNESRLRDQKRKREEKNKMDHRSSRYKHKSGDLSSYSKNKLKKMHPEENLKKHDPDIQSQTIPNYFSSSNEEKISSNEDAIKSVSSEVETGLDDLHLNDL